MTLPSGPTLRRRQAGPRRACPRATVRPSALTLACGSRCPTSPPTTASTHPTSRRPRRDLRGSRPRTSAAKWRLRRWLGASHQRALRRPARSCGRRPCGRLAIGAHEGRRRRGRRPCPTLSLPCAGAGRRQTRFVRSLLLPPPTPFTPLSVPGPLSPLRHVAYVRFAVASLSLLAVESRRRNVTPGRGAFCQVAIVLSIGEA